MTIWLYCILSLANTTTVKSEHNCRVVDKKKAASWKKDTTFGSAKVWILLEVTSLWMQLWPVAHFFSFCHHFWVGATAKQQQTHPKVMTEWKKRATGQSCIHKEVTSYKIHTLVLQPVPIYYCNVEFSLLRSTFVPILWYNVAASCLTQAHYWMDKPCLLMIFSTLFFLFLDRLYRISANE